MRSFALGVAMKTETEDWIDTRAIARNLGVTQEAAKNWQRAPTFPRYAARREGKRIFWHLPTVKQWREWRLDQ